MTEGRRRLVRRVLACSALARVSSPPRRFWAPQKSAPKGAIRDSPAHCLGRYKAPNARTVTTAIDRIGQSNKRYFAKFLEVRSFTLHCLSAITPARPTGTTMEGKQAALFLPFSVRRPSDPSQFHDIEEFHRMGMASEGMD